MSAPKVAVVTGASSGIGRALALACAREGMAVVAADKRWVGLQMVAPDSPELADWARLLRTIYPVPAETPEALYALQLALDQLDRGA